MKVNYDKVLSELIDNLDYKPKLLLHSCCGPCSSYVLTYLKDYFDISVIYYNPNIEPIKEYENRKEEQIKLLKILNIPLIDIDYDNLSYREFIKGYEECLEGGKRCHKCFLLRLDKVGSIALENNFEYFGTTLTVSPYKNAEVINNIGESLSNKYQIKWLYSDFKKKDGYKKSIELSHKYDLYRQHYCGCLFSISIEKEE